MNTGKPGVFPADGRENPEEITLFEAIGYAMEDVVTMKLAYDIAKKNGCGVQFEI